MTICLTCFISGLMVTATHHHLLAMKPGYDQTERNWMLFSLGQTNRFHGCFLCYPPAVPCGRRLDRCQTLTSTSHLPVLATFPSVRSRSYYRGASMHSRKFPALSPVRVGCFRSFVWCQGFDPLGYSLPALTSFPGQTHLRRPHQMSP